MALSAKYVLVCDDFRREDNGKFLVVGLYTPDIAVPMVPFGMPTLTFFAMLEADRPGDYSFRAKLQHMETGQVVVQAMGIIPVVDPNQPIICPIKFGGVMLGNHGTYSFSLEIDGQREPIITTFRVLLGAGVAIQGPPPLPR